MNQVYDLPISSDKTYITHAEHRLRVLSALFHAADLDGQLHNIKILGFEASGQMVSAILFLLAYGALAALRLDVSAIK